jgi:hypothetical protein
MKKAGKVLGILGGIILFYIAISMISFIVVDRLTALIGLLSLAGSGAAIIGNTYVEGRRLKRVLLIAAPLTSAVAFGSIFIPPAVSGSLKLANEVTFIILGVMVLTCALLILSAVFAFSKDKT